MIQRVPLVPFDVNSINTAYDDGFVTTAGYVVAVRTDRLPLNEGERIGEDGDFYPFTVDRDGQLRVTFQETARVQIQTLEVFREIRDLVEKCHELLLKIA